MPLQPALENGLAKLLPLSADDFDRLYVVASDPLVWEQHPSSDRYKREVFREFFDGAIASGSAFLVFDQASGELIGSTRYYDYNPAESSVAIGFTFLARKYWGGKYNHAMKSLLLDHAFQYVDTVLFHIGSSNIRSQKGTAKLGVIKTREITETINGAERRSFEYALSRETWEERKQFVG